MTTNSKKAARRVETPAANHPTRRAQFLLAQVDDFNARGLRRCTPPGIDIHLAGGPVAGASLWRERSGKVLVRCTSQGYRRSLRATMATGADIPDVEVPALLRYLEQILVQWMVEGVDDWEADQN